MKNELKKITENQFFNVIDVGARGGFKDLEQINSFVKMYGFEPEKESYQALLQQYNQFAESHFYQLALSDSETEQNFYITKHKDMSSFLESDFANFDANFREIPDSSRWKESMEQSHLQKARMTTLDSFCEGKSIDFVDFLKIDVQGFELKVLKGAKRLMSENKIGIIKSEVSFIPIYKKQPFFADIDLFLRDNDYILIDLLFYPEAINRMTKAKKSIRRQEKPKYCISGDAIYLPTNLKSHTIEQKIRMATILSCKGYFSNVFSMLENDFSNTEIEKFIDIFNKKEPFFKRIWRKINA
ncbi:FkbM family methyltransferase [Emticicia sp. SJ17W-69]|uniref:FkbM family methyltransferase n=1 Tax=Emticicia sp. SJ17W-69 TaxID=3421657 RepID=UPI003EBFF91F